MIRVLFFFFINAICLTGQDPVIFVESSSKLEIQVNSGSLAKAVADLNGDFRDDLLTVFDGEVVIGIQANNGTLVKEVYRDDIDGFAYTLNVADFNNDRFNDFLFSGFYKGIFTYLNNHSLTDFSPNQWIDTELYAQGCSLFDINNDGWIDAMMTHDEGTNQIFINDKSGNLIFEEIIDFNTIPMSDNSGNYSAIWVDVNGDKRQDLYISKCKNGVNDSADPRRINALYLNEEQGFREAASEFNVNQGEQTWCADSGDLDNDGDIDIFLINHGAPHMILENLDNNGFSIRTDYINGNPLTNFDLEVSIQDFNNDGLNDILVSGVKDNILLNKGDLQFSVNQNPFGLKNASSAAVGDINSDGYLDCYISFGGPATPSTIPDETWLNFGGNNNYIKLSLVGVNSNRSGIGTEVLVYSDLGVQTKWLNSGTAYGITNSLNLHFGLSQNETVDSILINWPSGITDKYYSIQANNQYILTEGECIETILEIEYESTILDCENEILDLNASTGANVIWNNGLAAASITVDSVGWYAAQSSNNGCFNYGPAICVDSLKMLNQPEINFPGYWTLCEGDKIELTIINDTESFLWSTQDSERNILIDQSGEYYAINSNKCDTINSESLIISFIENKVRDSLIMLDMAQLFELNIEGDSITWYKDELGETVIGEGPLFDFGQLLGDTVIYFSNTVDRLIPVSTGFANLDTSMIQFDSETVNGNLDFEVLRKTELLTCNVYAKTTGIRRVLIIQEGDTIFAEDFELEAGVNLLIFNVVLDVGDFQITTDIQTNQTELGFQSPDLSIISNPDLINYPYQISTLIKAEKSNFGVNKYFYFFDWEVKPAFDECISNIAKVEIMVDTTVSNINPINNVVRIHPIPATHELKLTSEYPIQEIEIFNTQGQRYMNSHSESFGLTTELDINHLPSGLYFIRIQSNLNTAVSSFVKK